MATSQATSCESDRAVPQATLAKALAPEEIRAGDFITPLSMIAEVPSFWWCADAWRLPLEEPIRLRYTATCDGVPMRVVSVCLPFVLVKQPNGNSVTIDVRRCQLARLDRAFAKMAWKCNKRSQRGKSGHAASHSIA